MPCSCGVVPVKYVDCAVQVTAGKAGSMCAFEPRAANSRIRGVCSPMSASVSPTTLMTAVRCKAVRCEIKRSCRRPAAARGPGHGSRIQANDLLLALILPVAQFVNGIDHPGQVHFVDFKALADAFEQRDRQFAAEMFAELLEAFKHDQGTG